MKLGLIADVRGSLAPLEIALGLLSDEGCDRVACLGSTAEGGENDDAVVAALQAADALVLTSPHDQPERAAGWSASESSAGLELSHDGPAEVELNSLHWATGFGVPEVLELRGRFESDHGRHVRGDLFEALVYQPDASGAVQERFFLRSGSMKLADGPALLCPGSVALATSWRRGGAVMTWDDERSELTCLRFDGEGRVEDGKPRMLVASSDFSPYLPDASLLEQVDLELTTTAAELNRQVEEHRPDLVLVDYHFEDGPTGLEAIVALREGLDALPVPVFTIAGNPADSEAMRSSGALPGLPHSFLKDAFERLIRQVVG
ncbi:MAG: hypothetical protein AAF533_27730 [Acidobacteriota bacterium]